MKKEFGSIAGAVAVSTVRTGFIIGNATVETRRIHVAIAGKG